MSSARTVCGTTLPTPDDIARCCAGGDAHAAAHTLVDQALRAGGHDNVTVAVIPIGGNDEFQLTINRFRCTSITIRTSLQGAGRVDAIVSVATEGDAAPMSTRTDRVEVIVIDCSTSMMSPAGKFDAAKRATSAAVDEIVDGTYFAIIAGTGKASAGLPAPTDSRSGPIRRPGPTRCVRSTALRPDGGTAMGAWLAHVRGVVGQHPGALTHAILLTDGKNEHETPEDLADEIALSEGIFTCDCRGLGTDWRVDELRAISSALLGTVDIVADPADLADDFAAIMRASMGKSIPELTLRLWTPAGARVEFVKQVAPTVEDLTHRRVDAGNQCGEYPLGSWGAEERDYHIQVVVEPAAVGREKLAARVTSSVSTARRSARAW